MLDMVYYIESRENMYSFLNDYSEGAHPLVLDALIHTNSEQTVGYGCDVYCQKAKEVILKRIQNQNAVRLPRKGPPAMPRRSVRGLLQRSSWQSHSR